MTNQLPTQTNEDLAKFQIRAIEARKRYAVAKKQIKSGERSLKSVLDDEDLRRMHARDVIASLPGMGKVSAKKAMATLGIAKSRRLGGLGIRQYKALLEKFGE